MSKSARRRAQRERAAFRAAVGLPPKQPPRRSAFTTADIRDVVQTDLADMRQQIQNQRDKAVDRRWAYRQKTATAVLKAQLLPT